MKEKPEVIKEAQIPIASSELMLPFSSAAVLWRAKFLAASPFLDHLPFLFWLIADIRPSRVVTLGFKDGVAHFAMCQAIERLGLDTACTGIALQEDIAENDSSKADNGSVSSLLRYNQTQYQEFSKIRICSSARAASQIDDLSVDLLVLEAFPDDLTTDSIVDHWLNKVSSKGLIVIPGAGSGLPNDLLSKVRYLVGKRRTILFEHGSNLAVVLPEDDEPGQLLALFEAMGERRKSRPIARFFERMGRQYSMEIAAKIAVDRRENAEAEAKNSRAWAKRLSEENEALNQIYDEQQNVAASLKSQLVDTKRSITELKKKVEEAEENSGRVSQELSCALASGSRLKEALQSKQELISENEQELSRLRSEIEDIIVQRSVFDERCHELEIRSEEIANLSAKLLEVQSNYELSTLENERLKNENLKSNLELSRLRSEMENVSLLHDALEERSDEVRTRFEEIATITKKLLEVQSNFSRCSGEIERLKSEIIDKNTLLERALVDKNELSRIAFEKDTQLDELRKERDELASIVHELYNSNSWKITAPFRSIVRSVRRG